MADYIALLNTILDHVEGKPGWQVMGIGAQPDAGQPGFAYTIGLHQNYSHPEVILFGLPMQAAHVILNDVGAQVKQGTRLELDVPYTDFVEHYPVMFKAVAGEYLEEYFGMALRFYGHANFHAIQMCWTDKSSHYPWQIEFDPRMKQAQPLLFEPSI